MRFLIGALFFFGAFCCFAVADFFAEEHEKTLDWLGTILTAAGLGSMLMGEVL